MTYYFVTEISQPLDHAFLPYPSSRPRLDSAAIRLRALLGQHKNSLAKISINLGYKVFIPTSVSFLANDSVLPDQALALQEKKTRPFPAIPRNNS